MQTAPDVIAHSRQFMQLADSLRRELRIAQTRFKVEFHPHHRFAAHVGHTLSRSPLSRLFTEAEMPGGNDPAFAGHYLKQVRDQLETFGAKPEAIKPLDEHLDAIDSAGPLPAQPTPPRKSHTDRTELELPETEMLSRAALEHFNLSVHPFQDDIQSPDDVYVSKSQRYILQSMFHTARHGGCVAVVGESGSGKSTIRKRLIDQLLREESEPIVVIEPATLDKTRLKARGLCEAIIRELSNETPKFSTEGISEQVHRVLRNSNRAGNRHVLVIEEAHDLTVPTIKYLKRFWELSDGFRRLLGIILIGQPELGMVLDERRNYEAREFIRRCEVAVLEPLNGNLEEYLAHKFGRIGAALDQVFESDAFDAMRQRLTLQGSGRQHSQSLMYPLVVQNLIIRALNQASDLGFQRINAELVRDL